MKETAAFLPVRARGSRSQRRDIIVFLRLIGVLRDGGSLSSSSSSSSSSSMSFLARGELDGKGRGRRGRGEAMGCVRSRSASSIGSVECWFERVEAVVHGEPFV